MVRALFLLSMVMSALLPFRVLATGQAAERVIVGCDTMWLFALPLETADSTVLARLGFRLKEIDAPWDTACWRAYIGVWRLDKGMLWLERVETTEGDPVFTGAELFPKSAEGSRARAVWFSGELRYGVGNLVYYQHGGFMRNLEREWIATLHKGDVLATKAYSNRHYEHSEERVRNVERVAFVFDSLYVGKLPDELILSVAFAADSTGKVIHIGRNPRLIVCGGDSIDDPDDLRLQTALRAFSSVSGWDAYWIAGEWMELRWTVPLRRGGTVWKPQRKRP